MDFKDKLEKAAEEYARECWDAGNHHRMTAFKDGVEWLQSQPLAERLNTEDVDNLNNIMFLMRGMAASHQMSYDCLKQLSNAIYDVFGKEIFEKQSRYAVFPRQRNV